ncbi:BRO-N domain-containing protein [Pseudomonas panipatensis]|uniref:Prophage antirepressor n=1 Tax=Pseudomonas panipatensis TaxID=428992 RepID=A0A1G8EGX0_9PSED|nr:Bro-N domain-containing protein [Pseudomonas panipatensis]SDH69122.1 Prophage antirepressor [Pseudomonas panipatensis]SMP67905.1 Prophage antirepressor [Pseudomonas panipatensis]
MNNEVHAPSVFIRYQRFLRALMLDDQPWFAARDLGALMGCKAEHYTIHRLDADLRRLVRLQTHSGEEDAWLVSEAGFFMLLSRYRHPENRSLRQWVTRDVIPTLRSTTHPAHHPRRALLRWNSSDIALLEWHDQLWVRYADLPQLLEPHPDQPPKPGWWRSLQERWRAGA